MAVATTELARGYRISRVIRGGWQLSSGHGEVERDRAIADMAAFVDAGIATFDCADIYTGVEEMIGAFRTRLARERGEAAACALKIHTKFVPDWEALATIDSAYVTRIVDRSLRRLGVERLDLVQFHWWNYDQAGVIEAARRLVELQRAGKIDRLGGTNFDAPHAAALVEAGIPMISMQVQYSLLDRRPERALAAVCARTGTKLLCYGTLAGGFLSERWLGAPEPTGGFANRSLVKYKLVIDDFGGWAAFQELLGVLARIAAKHRVDIAAIATRWVLDRPHVAATIVGARYADHLAATLRVFDVALDDADRAAIGTILGAHPGIAGDVFALERDRGGRHGRIMKYDLNRG